MQTISTCQLCSDTAQAAGRGHLQCMKRLCQKQSWHPETTATAAEHGHLDCLAFAHENGCPWNGGTSWRAAKHGRMEILDYALKHGCKLHYETCWVAASAGQVECLRYLHETAKDDDFWSNRSLQHFIRNCMAQPQVAAYLEELQQITR